MDQRSGATLQESPAPGGWTYLIWPGSVRVLGTRGRVAAAGTIEVEVHPLERIDARADRDPS